MTFEQYESCYSKHSRHPHTQEVLAHLKAEFKGRTMSYDEWNALFDEALIQLPR